MTITDEITIIANQLANLGKKPTVALVKTKLSSPVPLPTIISTLKSWTHDSTLVKLPTETKKSSPKQELPLITSPEIEKVIQQALQPIKTELAEIKEILSKIISKQN